MTKPRTDPAQLIREALDKNLHPQEELRYWFGGVTEFKAPAAVMFLLGWGLLLPIFGGLVELALTKLWYVGITNERVLFGHVKRPYLPEADGVFSVQIGDVTVGRRHHGELLVATPQKGLPAKFRLTKGTDLDKIAAMLSQGKVPTTAAAVPVTTLPPMPQA